MDKYTYLHTCTHVDQICMHSNTGLVYLSVYRVYYLRIIGGLQIGVPPRRPLDCARFKRHIIRPDHLCVYIHDHQYMHTCIYEYVIHIHTHLHTYNIIHTNTRTTHHTTSRSPVYAYIHIYHTYMYMHIYVHTHKDTRRHKRHDRSPDHLCVFVEFTTHR